MARKINQELHQRILKGAEGLFTQKGFHGVSVREIAKAAKTPVSNIYAHFKNKENLFRSILENYEQEYFASSKNLAKVVETFQLPDTLENLGRASDETVKKFANYFRLIYVDVVEFKGMNIHKMFQHMRQRYEENFGPALAKLQDQGVLNPHVDPVTALMAITMAFFNYFTVENVFGAENHYGMKDDEVIRQFAHLFTYGLAGRSESTKGKKKKPVRQSK